MSKTGGDRYLAFGVKEDPDYGSDLIAGDVVVGWINAKTGKGGLDDYFLAGVQQCEDDAESCPDSGMEVKKLSEQDGLCKSASSLQQNYPSENFVSSPIYFFSLCLPLPCFLSRPLPRPHPTHSLSVYLSISLP